MERPDLEERAEACARTVPAERRAASSSLTEDMVLGVCVGVGFVRLRWMVEDDEKGWNIWRAIRRF